MSAIVAVGSMAFDSIETPFGKANKILGGSVNYFSLAASYFTTVRIVSVVGEDFPKDHLGVLAKRGIDTSGLKMEHGNTFHWAGQYGYDLHEATTLSTHLNVFETFDPVIPDTYKAVPYVFLGNLAPHLQMKVLGQVTNPKFVAIDTMNFWIESSRDKLIDVIRKCNALIINESEIRQLTRLHNVVKAAEMVQSWGPKIVLVKRGEYGALLFEHNQIFSLPGLPLGEVKDPTGAGDTFAGGFMGYIASHGDQPITSTSLRKAVVHGCVMASFTVQDFGFNQLLNLDKQRIQERYQRFIELTAFHTA